MSKQTRRAATRAELATEYALHKANGIADIEIVFWVGDDGTLGIPHSVHIKRELMDEMLKQQTIREYMAGKQNA